MNRRKKVGAIAVGAGGGGGVGAVIGAGIGSARSSSADTWRTAAVNMPTVQ